MLLKDYIQIYVICDIAVHIVVYIIKDLILILYKLTIRRVNVKWLIDCFRWLVRSCRINWKIRVNKKIITCIEGIDLSQSTISNWRKEKVKSKVNC